MIIRQTPTFHMTNQEKVLFTLYYMYKSKGTALAFLQMFSLIYGNSILIQNLLYKVKTKNI